LETPPSDRFNQLVRGKREWHRCESDITAIVDMSQGVDSGDSYNQTGDKISFG
jgi:hypothetical protein